MAKMKKPLQQNPPGPNPFIPHKMSKTHIVSTSNPASPDEPQPTRALETSEQQAAPLASMEKTPIVSIQPAPSGEEEKESEEREEVAEPEPKTKEERKRKKKEKKMKKDKKTKRQKLAEQPSEDTPPTSKQVLKQLKEARKSQAPSTSTPSAMVSKPKVAPHETPSSELSMPSFSDVIPEEWPELTDIDFEKSPSQQTHQQVTTETTSDTHTEHPTVAKKAPHKFFPPDEEEEEEEAVPPKPPSTSTTPISKNGPGIGTGGKRRFKFSRKHHPDLHSSKTDVPPPVKKTAAARSTSPEYKLPTRRDTDKQSSSQKCKTTSPTNMSHSVHPKSP